MYNIYDCVDAFVPLLDTEYELILGRKGTTVQLRIGFHKKDCFHLMGLQYLKDRPQLNRDRGKVFDEIRARKITREQIESSDLYSKIEERVSFLPFLEEIFDSNETIFKYNARADAFSLIQADYLMKNRIENRNLFLFLSKDSGGKYFCRSFFTEDKRDYAKNQASWTLLSKKKIKISMNEAVVLCDKLAS